MSDDVFDDPAFEEWAKDVVETMLPKMRDSAVVASIIPEHPSKSDVKIWVETGAALFLGKPLILIHTGDHPIPEKLARVADEIVHVENLMAANAGEQITTAIQRVIERTTGTWDES